MEKLETKELLKRYGFRINKGLGQNFLIDDSVLHDIVKGAEIDKDDFVIEIGPGLGTLTKELLRKAKKVCAIELDDSLIPILKEELKDFDNLTLLHEDVMKVDFNEIIGDESSVKLVANLPYYLTTPIITKLLKGMYGFKSLTVMIQKEVAERISANPGGKEYGAITLFVQYYSATNIIRYVGHEAFIPQPKVDSAVVKLDRFTIPAVNVSDEGLMFKIIRESFNMRRKTISNALRNVGLSRDDLNKALERTAIDPMRRGETLSLKEFAFLSENIKDLLEITIDIQD